MSRGITAEVPSAAAPHRERRERERERYILGSIDKIT